jgi:4-diphosphocytidyl-2-C-methyl-D-erythritol kinase
VIRRGLAAAKLNLYLEVVGRRPDGWHDLVTLFQTLGFGDDVTVEATEAPGVVCEVAGAELPPGEGNLAVRAASAYLAAAGGGGARIRLGKRIPIGGGLGGGSSDAATVLRLLEEERRALGPDRLAAIAASLGSDVPFLLVGGTAIGRGRGERLEPLPAPPPVPVVLVVPPLATSTAKVYAAYEPPPRRVGAASVADAAAALASGVPARLREAHRNDLAFAAMRAYPELARYAALVERALGRPPCLTGSGSTLFDVPDPGELDRVVACLAPLPGRHEVTSFS